MQETQSRLSTFWKRVLAALENPDLLIQKPPQSTETAEMLLRVVNAITLKNNLQQSIEDWEFEIQRLEKEIAQAEIANDEMLIKRLRREQADYKDLRTAAEDSLKEVLQEVENTKDDLQKEREIAEQLMTKRKFFPRYW